MPYSKRQIIEVHFDLEQGTQLHPGIILSVEDVYNVERHYICAMISTTSREDVYTFPLGKGDTRKPLKDGSQVRTHLIFQIRDEDINGSSPRNSLTEDAFLRLIDHIDEVVFGVPFE